MGSGPNVTTTADTTPVTPNSVEFTDLPPAGGCDTEASPTTASTLVIPLVDVQTSTWRNASAGEPILLDWRVPRIRVLIAQELLGFVPPQYTETIRERNLTQGIISSPGREPQDVKVSLSG
jgi:hypothetical protein